MLFRSTYNHLRVVFSCPFLSPCTRLPSCTIRQHQKNALNARLDPFLPYSCGYLSVLETVIKPMCLKSISVVSPKFQKCAPHITQILAPSEMLPPPMVRIISRSVGENLIKLCFVSCFSIDCVPPIFGNEQTFSNVDIFFTF